jgi:predicted TIM-barrel fold metal-dependent hydrolase
MIIDSHTHIFPDDVAEKAIPNLVMASGGHLNAYTNGSLSGLAQSMEQAGVDHSVVLPIATEPDHGKGILKWIRSVRDFHPQIFFFASLHPKDPDIKERIREIREEGIQGLKFHPQNQDFAADSEEMFPIYEEAMKAGLTLHFHSGFDIGYPESDLADAFRFANVLERYPEMTMILAHAGGYKEWHQAYENFKDKTVFFDVAFVLDHLVHRDDKYLMALYEEKEDYFLFGTDSPWRSQEEDIRLVQNSSFFTEEQKEKLFYRNALRVLGGVNVS